MKAALVILVLLVTNFVASVHLTRHKIEDSQRAPASSQLENKTWSFKYKDLTKQSFSIKKQAKNYEEAFKSASKECFQILTDGVYPGEEKGLDIIDICANPKS